MTTLPARDGMYLIQSGVRVDVGLRIRGYHETGYAFPARTRRRETRLVIVHATAAENPPDAVYKNMMNHQNAIGRPQPLSVHFVIDQKGSIFQTADVDSRGAHCAGSYNSFSPNTVSVGIEVIGRLTDFRKVPDKGVARPRVKETIHGREVDVDEMLPAQCDAVAALCEALCALYALPLRVPENQDGTLLFGVMSEKAAQAFTGCSGHMHFEPSKPDPGAYVLQAIQARGRAQRRA